MRFLADESTEKAVVDELRRGGHDVLSIQERSPGVDDETVLQLAVVEKRILLTSDKDFGELVFRLGRVSAGIVLVRLGGYSNEAKALTVLDAINQYGAELPGAFTVIEPGQMRIRKA
jgi:predicted nuclease of predicted toxin-antitoxin system